MRFNINDLTITTLDSIIAFDIIDGSWLFTLDELQNATIANTEDKLDITGKGGRKLTSIKRNKAVTISGANGLISGGLLATQVGSEFEAKDSTPVRCADYLTIKSNKATTNYKAVGTVGNEIGKAYIKAANGTIKEVITQNTDAGEQQFAYNPASKELTFNEGTYTDGTRL